MPKARTAAKAAVQVEGATGKRSLQLDDLVLAVDRPTEQSFYAIQALVAQSYKLNVSPVNEQVAVPNDSAVNYKELDDAQESATTTSTRRTATKESHAARVAFLFQRDVNQMRREDAEFVGTPEQLSSLREALSLSWDWKT